MEHPNKIFSYKDENYNKIFNLPLITGIFLFSSYIIAALFVVFIDSSIYSILVVVILVGLLSLTLLTGFGNFLYELMTPSLKKYTPSFITKYLFARLKTINNNIAITEDEKIVVIKFYATTFFDEPEEVRTEIKQEFNNLIIYNSNYIPKMVFRTITKKISMKDYFNYFSLKNDALYKNPIYYEYYKNFEKQYENKMSSINDFNYFIELRFPVNTKDATIEDAIQHFYSTLVNGHFNISFEKMPKFLQGEEVYDYLKEIAITPNYEESSLLPIVSDVG